MPLYEYICEACGTIFERRLSVFTRNDPQKCPCGGAADRLVSKTSPPVFKGEGFYATDYKGKS